MGHVIGVSGDIAPSEVTVTPDPMNPNHFDFTVDRTRSYDIPLTQPVETFIGGVETTTLLRTEYTQCTPEPSSLALLGMGTLSLLGYGWRCRKQVAA
jgi:hypothetical protein